MTLKIIYYVKIKKIIKQFFIKLSGCSLDCLMSNKNNYLYLITIIYDTKIEGQCFQHFIHFL